jgi:hypothetical protein
MTLRSLRKTSWALGLLALSACQQDLTAPGACPATCPGGTPIVRDTVLTAIFGGDTTFVGYVPRGGTASGLRVSNGVNGAIHHAVIGFLPRPDSLRGAIDTLNHSYVIDSVTLEIGLIARDTLASGMRLELYRIPSTTDSSADFAEIDALIVPGNFLDSVTIADSVRPSEQYRFRFLGADLAKVEIPAADSVLAIAVVLVGGSNSGVRIAGRVGNFTDIPTFRTYVTLNSADTAASAKKQVIVRGPDLVTYVSSVEPTFDIDRLRIGTGDVARSLIRFEFPAYLRDTAILARATLELTPTGPFVGISGDSAFVDVYGVRADYGAKSPPGPLGGRRLLVMGSADTVSIDVVSELQAWQFERLPHPPVLLLRHSAEGGNYIEPEFYSTRFPAGAPRLRITYQLPFDFERP